VTTWTEIYGGQSERVRAAVDLGPVVIAGVPGSGRTALATEVAGQRKCLEIWPHSAGTAEGLRQDVTRSILRAVAGEDTSSLASSEYALRVASAFGSRAPAALALGSGEGQSDLTLSEVLEGIPSDVLILIHDAHLLADVWAERALWAFRRRCQAPNPPGLALLTRPWHLASLTGPKAAFLGFSETVELTAPELVRWSHVSDGVIEREDLAWLVEQTRGVPRPTLAVLHRIRAGRDVVSAWTEHVRAVRDVALWVDRFAHGLHSYGSRLIRAVAAGLPVYPAVPGARTDAIATALRILRDHDLIYQPKRRQWVVADPAWIPHLRNLSMGGLEAALDDERQ
jgi:hypothetical protein